MFTFPSTDRWRPISLLTCQADTESGFKRLNRAETRGNAFRPLQRTSELTRQGDKIRGRFEPQLQRWTFGLQWTHWGQPGRAYNRGCPAGFSVLQGREVPPRVLAGTDNPAGLHLSKDLGWGAPQHRVHSGRGSPLVHTDMHFCAPAHKWCLLTPELWCCSKNNEILIKI